MSCTRSFHAFSLSWLSMYSCNRKPWTHKEGPHIKKKHYRKWKIVGVNPFSMENAWCSVVIVSLWAATQMSTASQETSKIAQMDLCYNEQTKTWLLASATLQKPGQSCSSICQTLLWNNCLVTSYSRREISFSYWYKVGYKHMWWIHPKYTSLYSVCESIVLLEIPLAYAM